MWWGSSLRIIKRRSIACEDLNEAQVRGAQALAAYLRQYKALNS
jgi:hypothetical protein